MSDLLPGPRRNWLERLVEEAGRAVQAGNAQTARLIALLAVAAAGCSAVLVAAGHARGARQGRPRLMIAVNELSGARAKSSHMCASIVELMTEGSC